MPSLELTVCIINPRDLIAPPLMTKCSLTFRRRGQDEELKDQDFYQKFKRKRGLLFQQKKLKMKLKGLLCEFFWGQWLQNKCLWAFSSIVAQFLRLTFVLQRPPVRSTRGQRISQRPRATNANRRQYGKGMVGRWLNRTIKRKRLTSTVKKQIENLSDHR